MHLCLCFDDYLCGHQRIPSQKLPWQYKVIPKDGASLDSYILFFYVTNTSTNLWIFSSQS